MPSKKRESTLRRASSASRVKARVSQLELLVMEAYAILCRGLTVYGVPIARQRALFKKSCAKTGKITPISSQLLEQFRCVSELLTTWLQELPYVDATGRPKVLPIRGRGATFESLARQFLPERSIEEAVALACQSGTVDKLSRGRIAVYGDPMINIAENPEATLAQAICHITNIIHTVTFNARRGKKDRATGRLERIVNADLTPQQFELFIKLFRAQLDALTASGDRVLTKVSRTKTRDKGRLAGGGIGIYLYHRDDGGPPRRARSRAPRRP